MPKPRKVAAEPKPLDIRNPDDNHAINAAKVTPPEKTGALCSVGLKLPTGLRLYLQKRDQQMESSRDGKVRSVELWMPDYEAGEVVLAGNATPKGEQPRCLVIDGYAITPNISMDFMTTWMKQNQDLDMVKNRLIIVHEKKSHVRGMAQEMAGKKSGLEPISPDSDARIPKRKKGNKVHNLISSADKDDED